MATSTTPQIDPAELKRRKIGRILTKLGKATREQVHEALEKQVAEGRKRPVGQILIEMGLITERDVQEALAGQGSSGRCRARCASACRRA